MIRETDYPIRRKRIKITNTSSVSSTTFHNDFTMPVEA